MIQVDPIDGKQVYRLQTKNKGKEIKIVDKKKSIKIATN
jgi:hypothetical protein